MTLNQTGETFSGSYEHGGNGLGDTCGALGAGIVLDGSITENRITFDVDNTDASFTGTVNEGTMQGTGAILVDLGPGAGTLTLRGAWDAIRRPTPNAEGNWMFSYTVWDPADQFRRVCYGSGEVVTLRQAADTAQATVFRRATEAPGFIVNGTEHNGIMRCEFTPDLGENNRLGDLTETPIQIGFNQAEAGLLSMDLVSHMPDVSLSSGDIAQPDGIIHLFQGRVYADSIVGRAAMTMRFNSGSPAVMMEGAWHADRR